jgi:hypothetical protein
MNYATLTYYSFGIAGTSYIFDAESFSDWADVGSTVGLSSLSSGSTSDHRWYAPEASSWVVSDANSGAVTYHEQCQLTVSVVPSDATSASGSGWYDEGENVDLLVPDLVDSGTGVRYVFASWNVDGNRVNARSISVKVDNPQVAEAMYITQYYLDVQSVRGNPQGSGWYDSDSEAAISVESPVGSIVRQVFVKWSGVSSEYVRDLHITVDRPRTVTAEWRTDYTQLYILIAGILLVGLVAAVVIILVLRRQRQARLQM